jgi:processive 1,2-diacylglycerol beta-glucosyltransferase
MKKKILIIYATAGEGHKRAAFALKDAFEILKPDGCEIRLIDSLDYTDRLFKWLYPRFYIFMVTYIPTIWGFFYYFLDYKRLYRLVKFIRRIANRYHTKGFEKFLCDYQPDIVATTHFLASEIISSLKQQRRLDTKLITCITDFRMHSFWFSDQTDHFCAGFMETKDDLTKKWGVEPEKVKVFGMPIHPKFYEAKNRNELCVKLGLSGEPFTVLITGGGFGIGPIMGLVKALTGTGAAIQILVVCGHNAKLKAQIDQLSPPIQDFKLFMADPPTAEAISYQLSAIRTYGFIDYIDELMVVSDVGITKAGGLICSEAISKGLPLIIISPIPGQEGRNCKLLLLNRAAFRVSGPAQIKGIIQKLNQDRDMLIEVRENIKRIRKENPAVNIAKFILEA